MSIIALSVGIRKVCWPDAYKTAGRSHSGFIPRMECWEVNAPEIWFPRMHSVFPWLHNMRLMGSLMARYTNLCKRCWYETSDSEGYTRFVHELT